VLKWLLLGCGEMIKRIPCRVVRTKPIGKSRDVSPVRSPWASSRRGVYWFTSNGASRSNHFHHKIGDDATGIAQGKYTSDVVTYTRLLEITSVSMDNGLAGQILDCYV